MKWTNEGRPSNSHVQRPLHIGRLRVSERALETNFRSLTSQPWRCQNVPSVNSTRLIKTPSRNLLAVPLPRLFTFTALLGPDKLNACKSFPFSGLIRALHRNWRRVTLAGCAASL